MPEQLTAQTVAENQRNSLCVALLNSERNIALLNQALMSANARISALEAAHNAVTIPEKFKFVGDDTLDEDTEVHDPHS